KGRVIEISPHSTSARGPYLRAGSIWARVRYTIVIELLSTLLRNHVFVKMSDAWPGTRRVHCEVRYHGPAGGSGCCLRLGRRASDALLHSLSWRGRVPLTLPPG